LPSALLLLIFVSIVAQTDGKKSAKGIKLVGAIAPSKNFQNKRTTAFNVMNFGAAADGKSDSSADSNMD